MGMYLCYFLLNIQYLEFCSFRVSLDHHPGMKNVFFFHFPLIRTRGNS